MNTAVVPTNTFTRYRENVNAEKDETVWLRWKISVNYLLPSDSLYFLLIKVASTLKKKRPSFGSNKELVWTILQVNNISYPHRTGRATMSSINTSTTPSSPSLSSSSSHLNGTGAGGTPLNGKNNNNKFTSGEATDDLKATQQQIGKLETELKHARDALSGCCLASSTSLQLIMLIFQRSVILRPD